MHRIGISSRFHCTRANAVSNSEAGTNGIVTGMIEKLTRRCSTEIDPFVRDKLAICLGEVGAISEINLEDMTLYRSKGDDSLALHRWRLEQPPWQCRAQKYGLILVTKHLVAALRAAPNSAEQMKIAFSIQQLLVLLDASVRATETDSKVDEKKTEKREMSKWLYDRLVDSNVYETIEPFWSSEFSERVSCFVLFLYYLLICIFISRI